MKNALKSIGNSAAHVGKSTSKLKDRNIEIIWVEEERKQRFFLNKKKFTRTIQLHLKRKHKINGYARMKE